MNKDQAWGAAQHLFTALIALAVGKGWIPADLAGDIVAIVLFSAAWYIQHRWNATPGAGSGRFPFGLILLALILPCALGPMAGCESLKQEVAKPAVQAAVKEVALIALKAGLATLADRVQETRPYIEPLLANIELSVPFTAAPAETAAELKAQLAATNAPPTLQAQLLATMREALAAPPPSTVPAAPAQAGAARDYCADVAKAL